MRTSHTGTERQRERHTDIQTDKQRKRERDRQRETQRHRERGGEKREYLFSFYFVVSSAMLSAFSLSFAKRSNADTVRKRLCTCRHVTMFEIIPRLLAP